MKMGIQAESEVIYENCPFSWLPLEVLRAMSQQQQQYKDPPPYPGHSKQIFTNQPGFRQSFSGSETSTDVSLSSTENLATWQRQEPQGEETQTPLYHQLDHESYSILARLGMPTGAIESKGSLEQLSSSSSPASSPSPFSGASSHYSFSTPSQSIYSSSSHSGKDRLTNVYSLTSSGHQSLTVPHPQSRGLPHPHPGHYSRSLTPTYQHQYVNQYYDASMQEHSLQVPYALPLPPPPQYPVLKADDNGDFRRPYEVSDGKVEHTRSQPDLYSDKNVARKLLQNDNGGMLGSHTSSEPTFSVLRTSGSSNNSGSDERLRPEQMVELLTEENRRLQAELAHYYRKVSKLQKFEMEIQKVHEAYESLVKSSQKRERLENALKAKLDEEVKKLRTQNEELRVQLQKSQEAKKLDRELLESKKDTDAGGMEKLQKTFGTLLTTAERREGMEKQLRSRLERELDTCKSEERGTVSNTCTPKEETKSVTALKQILSDKETKILQLETEIVRWEQRYLELQATHQMEENSGPQHAHLVALEKSSAQTEKLIDEAKTEKLRHMEELYQSNRHVAELEAKVKQLQTQLTEKEAMIKVYQRSGTGALPRSSSVHAICCSPHHSPRPSLIATTAYTRPTTQLSTGSSSAAGYYSIKHIKTGSTSSAETGRKMSLDDTLTNQESYEMGKGEIDREDDETMLWQV